MMNAVPALLILLFVSALVIIYIARGLKGASGIKTMLIGINITLVGGIIAADANSFLGGVEYLIVLAGLMISAAGLRKEG